MRIVPETTINLYKDVTIDNGEQIVFTSRANQAAYFRSKLLRSNVNCTVVKEKSGAIKLDLPGSLVSQCNYLSFINPHFDNKIIYCKILDYNYINNECVEISYVIDPWQTWCFELEFEDCFISREHISEADYNTLESGSGYGDTIPELLTPENLAIGEEIEKYAQGIYSADYNNEVKDNPNTMNFGQSLFYERTPNPHVPSDFMDCIFVSTINFDEFDTEQMYRAAFWYEYVEDTGGEYPQPDPDEPGGSTVDGNEIPHEAARWDKSSFSSWLAYKIATDPDNYKIVSPSTRIKKLRGDIINHGEYALFTASSNGNVIRNWMYEFSGTAGSDSNVDSNVAPNTAMNMPYDIYCVEHGSGLAEEIIDAYTSMGAVSSIIAMYTLPKAILEDYFYNNGKTKLLPTSKARMNNGNMRTVESHKLLRFPYCYVTLEDCDGNQKELHYEKMALQNNGSEFIIRTFLDMNVQPCLVATPECSPFRLTDSSAINGISLKDSMIVDSIPQTPYVTDQYLAFVASSAQSLIGSNTSQFAKQVAGRSEQIKYIDPEMGVEGKIAGIPFKISDSQLATMQSGLESADDIMSGDYFKAAKGTSEILRSGLMNKKLGSEYEIAKRQFEGNLHRIGLAYGSLGGDNALASVELSATKPAFVANIYHAGSRGGILHYLKGLDPIDIYVHYHQPSDVILEKYDNYFKLFGYSSGRCGMPRVLNYMKGVNDNSKLPHWVTTNGKQTTYIQTSSMKVMHAMAPVAEAIKAMFDSGVRFIKGR